MTSADTSRLGSRCGPGLPRLSVGVSRLAKGTPDEKAHCIGLGFAAGAIGGPCEPIGLDGTDVCISVRLPMSTVIRLLKSAGDAEDIRGSSALHMVATVGCP
mmetsp:Transcript_148754/g.262687  ORF Transcript_148754/g.262687 Transcript_148754/m.262687 type:complete len:102 (+) Transcript_148754:811-1116(+)